MRNVLQQYEKRISWLLLRAHEAKGNLLPGERKAVAYYTAAAERVSALIAAPTPEWVTLQFGKKSAF
jgi:hypothetical protein